jgi:hypothetical protein
MSSPEPPFRRSSPAPPLSRLSPAPPVRRSSPAPPFRRSSPPPPVRRSSPRPPDRRSSPAPPFSRSSPEPPFRRSSPPATTFSRLSRPPTHLWHVCASMPVMSATLRRASLRMCPSGALMYRATAQYRDVSNGFPRPATLTNRDGFSTKPGFCLNAPRYRTPWTEAASFPVCPCRPASVREPSHCLVSWCVRWPHPCVLPFPNARSAFNGLADQARTG